MKNFAKLALLGAAIAVSASAAHASSFLTGTIVVSDVPVVFSGSGGAFNLSGVTNNQLAFPPQPLPNGGGSPALNTYVFNDSVSTFNSSAAIPAGGKQLWSGSNSMLFGGDTETFFATSFGPEIVGANGDFSIVAFGFFTDTAQVLGSAQFTQTAGIDNITYNATGNSIQESLTAAAAPEPNSLILLGTGLVSAAGAFMRKRVIA